MDISINGTIKALKDSDSPRGHHILIMGQEGGGSMNLAGIGGKKKVKKQDSEEVVGQESDSSSQPKAATVNPLAMLGGGGGEMSGNDKRKLINEIKNEMKPFITSLCEFAIGKATQAIKMGMRKSENDMVVLGQRMSDKIDREALKARTENAQNNERLVELLEGEIRKVFKAIARNKTDTDI